MGSGGVVWWALVLTPSLLLSSLLSYLPARAARVEKTRWRLPGLWGTLTLGWAGPRTAHIYITLSPPLPGRASVILRHSDSVTLNESDLEDNNSPV